MLEKALRERIIAMVHREVVPAICSSCAGLYLLRSSSFSWIL